MKKQTVQVSVSGLAPQAYGGDGLVFFVSEENSELREHSPAIRALLEPVVACGDFRGKEGEVLVAYPAADGDTKNRFKVPRVFFVGLGKKDKEQRPATVCEMLRKAGGSAAQAAGKTKAVSIGLALPVVEEVGDDVVARCVVEGALMGSYRFDRHKTGKKDDDTTPSLKKIQVLAGKKNKTRAGVQRGSVVAGACNRARDMANEPANFWTPSDFARAAKEIAAERGLVLRVFQRAEMKRMGMGGIIGVSQGSAAPPTMVVLEYMIDAKKPTLLLVGKGLTFDSGGVNIKPSAGMEEMKMDMCGGAAVMVVMDAVGQERPRHVNVVGIVPASENLLGPAAMKPGDVVTMYGGTTVEVINTDAEGRLLVADALAYGVKKYKPAAVVDVATLTGAVVVALGHHRTGLMANDDDLVARIVAAADNAGEPVWRLPLGPEYRKMMDSRIADLKNVGNRTGGTLTAGAFLQEFVGDTPWAHLDIAGTAWDYTEKSYLAKGPSAAGVRPLLELIHAWR